MGNCLTKCKRCFNSSENPAVASSLIVYPPAASSSTELPEVLQEWIDLFKEIEDTDDIDELINMIQQLLQRIKSKQRSSPGNASTTSQLTQRKEERSMWTSIVNKGSTFLMHLHRFGSSEKLHRGIKVVAETLQQVGQINSMLGVLSSIAYVLSKYEKMRDNQLECLTALEDLIDLARHIRNMKKMVPEDSEKFTKAIQLIVEGSIMCLCQLEENTLFRFIESSVSLENLTNLQKRISNLYPNLVLTSIMDVRKDIATCLPRIKPIYPENAVGIGVQVNEIVNILRTHESSLAVVIHGFGGLGKTTLANAVVSNMDLQHYNYTSLELHQEQGKNAFTKLQKRVLNDCFPDYNGGKPIKLRDSKDGQSHLMEAFKSEKNKPIFIFIDNALRSIDLESLLPLDLSGLPKGSKILITRRFLPATDTLLESQPNLERYPYRLHHLRRQDALEILFKDPSKRETIKDEDIKRILRICCGVPLALKIVGAHLHKQNYSVERCADILENLEEGDTIKEERLSERLIDFVYGELEEYIQEALLDICCFFNEWKRHDVEFIVGSTAVTSLIEAGLITMRDVDNFNWVDHNKLTVHDIIRANGQGKAKGNRILDIQSFCDAADRQRLDQVKGVWLDKNTSEYVIEERQLNLMRDSLRVLVLGEGIKVSGVSQMSFKQLKFLQIFSDIPQLPVKLERLDKLRVFHGPPWIFFEGEVYNLSKLPRNLKSMKVISQFTNTGIMIGACSSLEKLDFSGSGEPPKLSEGFNQLEALKILILDDNDQMNELPGQICQLSSLQALSLRRCRGLKCLPESLEQLTNLLYLNLNGCWNLQQLPDTFGQLANLKYLDLEGCRILKLPDTFGKLANLKYLDLGCWIEGPLPTNFGQLRCLQHLRCAEELKGEVQVLIDNGVFDGSRLTFYFYTTGYRERERNKENLREALLVAKAASHFIDGCLLQG